MPHQMAVRKLLQLISGFKKPPNRMYLRYKFGEYLNYEMRGRTRAMRGGYQKNKPRCVRRSPKGRRWNKNRNKCWSKRKPAPKQARIRVLHNKVRAKRVRLARLRGRNGRVQQPTLPSNEPEVLRMLDRLGESIRREERARRKGNSIVKKPRMSKNTVYRPQ